MEEYKSIKNGLTFSFTVVGSYKKYPIVSINWKAVKTMDVCTVPIQLGVMSSTGRCLLFVSQEQRSHIKAREECFSWIDKHLHLAKNF